MKLYELATNVAAIYMAIEHSNLDDKECRNNLDTYALSILQTVSIILERKYDAESLEGQIKELSDIMPQHDILDASAITDEHTFTLSIMHLCMACMELIGAAKYALA